MAVYGGVLWGQETTHVWNGSFTLGAWNTEITKIVGLHSLPEADDFRAPRTEAHGEVVYPSYKRGKTITYSGLIIGSSAGGLRTLQTQFLSAFDDRNSEHSMVVGSAYYFNARPIALDMDDEQAASPWTVPYPFQRGFILSLRMSDPFYYSL